MYFKSLDPGQSVSVEAVMMTSRPLSSRASEPILIVSEMSNTVAHKDPWNRRTVTDWPEVRPTFQYEAGAEGEREEVHQDRGRDRGRLEHWGQAQHQQRHKRHPGHHGALQHRRSQYSDVTGIRLTGSGVFVPCEIQDNTDY